ncbi:hypothetical protein NEUTE2DRAFT_119019, partial [Neurospora tetrasperma FGSC 2509]
MPCHQGWSAVDVFKGKEGSACEGDNDRERATGDDVVLGYFLFQHREIDSAWDHIMDVDVDSCQGVADISSRTERMWKSSPKM